MNLDEEFPSKWMAGDDIEDPRVVTIADVEIVEFDSRQRPGQKDRKVALHFKGEEKGMICNVGMREIVKGFYGPDTDDWIGKKIRIMAAPFTNDKGETSMVCRISPKKPDGAPVKRADDGSDDAGFDAAKKKTVGTKVDPDTGLPENF